MIVIREKRAEISEEKYDDGGSSWIVIEIVIRQKITCTDGCRIQGSENPRVGCYRPGSGDHCEGVIALRV
jgi:hypothetical protein